VESVHTKEDGKEVTRTDDDDDDDDDARIIIIMMVHRPIDIVFYTVDSLVECKIELTLSFSLFTDKSLGFSRRFTSPNFLVFFAFPMISGRCSVR